MQLLRVDTSNSYSREEWGESGSGRLALVPEPSTTPAAAVLVPPPMPASSGSHPCPSPAATTPVARLHQQVLCPITQEPMEDPVTAADGRVFVFLHGLTSGIWSVTEPSPDAPGPRGQGMSICYNRALAAELVSSSLNCVKVRYRGSNPRPLARYCSHKAGHTFERAAIEGECRCWAVAWCPFPALLDALQAISQHHCMPALALTPVPCRCMQPGSSASRMHGRPPARPSPPAAPPPGTAAQQPGP